MPPLPRLARRRRVVPHKVDHTPPFPYRPQVRDCQRRDARRAKEAERADLEAGGGGRAGGEAAEQLGRGARKGGKLQVHGRDKGRGSVGDVNEGDEAAEEDGGGEGVGLAGLDVAGEGDEGEEGADEDGGDFESGEEGDSWGGGGQLGNQ